MSNNFARIWKSATVNLGCNKYMIVMYYYHTDREDKSKAVYKCCIRIDTKENWNILIDTLVKDNPADIYKNYMLGINDNFELHSHRIFTKVDMYNWMKRRLSPKKIFSSKEKFLYECFKPSIPFPFFRKYLINTQEIDISETDKIPEGQWFFALKEKKPRKPYGRIIY